MLVFAATFISGLMVGIEVKFLEEKAPFVFSIVLDLFIIRFVIQKFKHVR